MKKILIAYVPVLHRGYIEFFQRHKDADALYVFGTETISEFDHLKRKDPRAVDPLLMKLLVTSLGVFKEVKILDGQEISLLKGDLNTTFVFANESESRDLANKYFVGYKILFDDVFLRLDRSRVEKQEEGSPFTTTNDEMHRLIMGEAIEVSKFSPDWYRQVGAILIAGKNKIVAYNAHVPTEQNPYFLGDPRGFFNRGVGIELTTALHSELAVIGRAAREGTSTRGGKLYVTTFPCPFCANAISKTGISELYYHSGYSVLDGAGTLLKAGIKIFRVVG